MKFKFFYKPFIPLTIFSILYIPFWGSIPHLDGNIDFVKAFDFNQEGLVALFSNWGSTHPPIKEIVVSIFFRFLGVNLLTYSLVGYLFGILSLIFLYLFAKNFLGVKVALLSSIFFSANPLFLSTSIFAQNEFIVTTFILAALFFYSEKKYFYYGIITTLAVLTKETAIVFCLSVLLTELVILFKKFKFSTGTFLRIIFMSTPLIAFLGWMVFLKQNNESLWSDWNFSETNDKGSIYTVLNNIVTFGFLNKYAYENWKHLFLLNFNWIYFLVISIYLATLVIIKGFKKIVNQFKSYKYKKIMAILVVFSAGHIFAVLTFQTFTIPRYILPVIPFVIIFFSFSFIEVHKFLKLSKIYFGSILASIVFVSLFSSIDPVSKKVWGKDYVLGEEVYTIHKNLSGNDGITYNLQYAKIVKKRSSIILSGKNENTPVKSEDCHWIFPDPTNDARTLKILNLESVVFSKCLNRYPNGN